MKLEDLTISASVQGVLADSLVTVVSVRWFGDSAVELTYKTPSGQVANELLYRDDESRIEAAERGRPWGSPNTAVAMDEAISREVQN